MTVNAQTSKAQYRDGFLAGSFAVFSALLLTSNLLMPGFMENFKDLKVEMPLLLRWLIEASYYNTACVVIIAAIGSCMAYRHYMRRGSHRE